MKVTKTIRSTIVGVCVLALSLSTVVTANAAEQDKVETLSNSTTTHSVSEQNYIPFNEQELTDGLNLIMSIPDEVILQGSPAITAWVEKNYPGYLYNAKSSFWSCTFAITKTIASTLVAPAKIMKLKKAIDAAGGVRKVVSTISKHGFSLEAMETLGGAMKAVIDELTGFADIKRGCFD
ncbi:MULTISPECIES: hypothetical protein [Actinotignum]|uniref:Uncharacterized protein n=3 Tax=Bacteria TaxID=2 RepID=A0AAW9HD84_9ACTO|nr:MULTISPECIES: hypothetical protein [Actinotignum]MBS5748353.1 hypothetical protein [Actinotignum schaalii]MDE1558733.1 hypothetical protein [Actinotignum schaalii]MDE1663649.1 hypothetical protein [Actinotignum schaalii]MDK6373226.1 hypothetical protein [Actinotignum timonense]MDK6419581.1 hypothetical protein [Actinotignum timonense]